MITCFYIALTHQHKLSSFQLLYNKLYKIQLIFKLFWCHWSWNYLHIQVHCTL